MQLWYGPKAKKRKEKPSLTMANYFPAKTSSIILLKDE